jgi:hypothetical protein
LVDLTEPSLALVKEWERRSVAASVGKMCIVRVWNNEDSQGCNASRKSLKAPGGEGDGVWRMALIGGWIVQPAEVGLIEAGAEVEGTW